MTNVPSDERVEEILARWSSCEEGTSPAGHEANLAWGWSVIPELIRISKALRNDLVCAEELADWRKHKIADLREQLTSVVEQAAQLAAGYAERANDMEARYQAGHIAAAIRALAALDKEEAT